MPRTLTAVGLFGIKSRSAALGIDVLANGKISAGSVRNGQKKKKKRTSFLQVGHGPLGSMVTAFIATSSTCHRDLVFYFSRAGCIWCAEAGVEYGVERFSKVAFFCKRCLAVSRSVIKGIKSRDYAFVVLEESCSIS